MMWSLGIDRMSTVMPSQVKAFVKRIMRFIEAVNGSKVNGQSFRYTQIERESERQGTGVVLVAEIIDKHLYVICLCKIRLIPLFEWGILN